MVNLLTVVMVIVFKDLHGGEVKVEAGTQSTGAPSKTLKKILFSSFPVFYSLFEQ